MMDLPKLFILDVAHGNCAILQEKDGVIIFDCAHGDTLIETLRILGISYVDRIVISHADEDHVKGFIDLLSDESIRIGNIYINPDGSKKTRTWTNLRRLIQSAVDKNSTNRNFIYKGMTGLEVGGITIQILAPSMDMVGHAGGLDLDNKKLSSNSVSVVTRLIYKERGVALLAGDIDRIGLNNLLQSNLKISSDVLIFPHHGGNVSSAKVIDNKDFAKELCSQVKPKLVIFSTGREKHNNPKQEIVQTVLETLPDVHIICTQLAKSCSSEMLPRDINQLSSLPAKGKATNHCCGGTIEINLNDIITYLPNKDSHQEFVQNLASPLCKFQSP